MITSFLILTFYSIIAGWVLYYCAEISQNLFARVGVEGVSALSGGAFEGETAENVVARFSHLSRSPNTMILCHGIFILMVCAVVSRGVKDGIEKATNLLMPGFFVLLLLLTVVALLRGDASAAVNFLFAPDFDKLADQFANGQILISAVGQAFFSVGLGAALMITYGLYVGRDQNIPKAARLIAFADTGVALVAGLAIFPIVFAFGLEPSQGPGLMFVTLPIAFNQMAFGGVVSIAFFFMAFFAAFTSAISLFEACVAYFGGAKGLSATERRTRRKKGAALTATGIFVIGIANVYSIQPLDADEGFWNTWYPLEWVPLFSGKTLFDVLDVMTTNILMPAGALFTSIFVGYVLSRNDSREELSQLSHAQYQVWRFLVRYICPAFIFLILLWGAIVTPMTGS